MAADPQAPPLKTAGPATVAHLVFWLAMSLAGQALLLNTGFVNQEFAFSDAARSLAGLDDGRGLARYWEYQANPLGYSFVASLFMRLWPPASLGSTGPDAFWVARLPALMGMVLLLFGGWWLMRQQPAERRGGFAIWAGLATLNPLVWLYAGKATADVLPTGIAMVALAVAWSAQGRPWRHLVAVLLLASAALIKYNSLLLVGGLVAVVLFERGRPRKAALAAAYVVIPAACLLAYVRTVQQSQWVVSPALRAMLRVDDPVGHWPDVFGMYVSYLTMLCGFLGLLPLIVLWRRRTLAPAVATTAVACAIFAWLRLRSFRLGEMDYGAFNHLLPGALLDLVRVAGLAVGVALGAWIIHEAVVKRDRLALMIAAAVVPYLVIASLTRPTQRYLLPILPLVLLFLVVAPGRGLEPVVRGLAGGSMAVFAAASLVGSLYLASEGQAGQGMARWIVEHGAESQVASDPWLAAQVGWIYPAPTDAAPGPARFALRAVAPGAVPAGGVPVDRETIVIFGWPIRDYVLIDTRAP